MSIRKDALEYAKAKLNYGEGAGLLRRKIGAKLSEKLQDEDYRIEFEKELEDIDMSDLQDCVDREHRVKAGLKIGKKILAGLGITLTTAIPVYLANREQINTAVKAGAKVAKEKATDGINFVKRKLQSIKLRFQKKQEPLFYKNEQKRLEDFKDRIDPSSYNQM